MTKYGAQVRVEAKDGQEALDVAWVLPFEFCDCLAQYSVNIRIAFQ